MPNVMLTDQCNLNCSYCFASQVRRDSTGKGHYLTFAALGRIIAFLTANKVEVFRMIGGEPTLHPQFEKILERVFRSFEQVGIYSNGLWPAHIRDLFAQSAGHRLQFLINVNEPNTYRPGQWETLMKGLEILRGKPGVILGINIHHQDYDLDFPLKLAAEFGFASLRYSIARPILGAAQNSYIPFKQFKSSNLNDRIFRFVSKAWQAGIKCYHDCVLPPCFFPDAQLGALSKMGLWYSFSCKAALDIHPDLTVSRCFAMSGFLRVPLKKFKTLVELERFFEVRLAPVARHYYALDECYDCAYHRSGLCQGGCFSELLQTNEIINEASQDSRCRYCSCIDLPGQKFEAVVPELAPTTKLLSSPTRENPKDTTLRLINTRTGECIKIGRSFPRLMSYVDGQTTIAKIVDQFLKQQKFGSKSQVITAIRELFFSGMMQPVQGPFFINRSSS
jgi:MoaA/NifB/PqqE/SkfB family radical SAM enzyme